MLKLEQEIEQINDKNLKACKLLELGVIESFRKNFDKSIRFMEEAQKLFLEQNNTIKVAICNAELALTYYKSVSSKLINSLALLNEAQNMLKGHKDNNEAYAKVLHYLGILYYSEKRFSEALIYYMKAINLVKDDCIEYAKIHDSLSLFYLRLNNHEIAVRYLESALKIKRKLRTSTSSR